MPVQDKKQQNSAKPQPGQAAGAGAAPVTTGTGKEQEAIYKEQGELLAEVREKYREADLEAQGEVKKALGKEASLAKNEVVIPPDLADQGVRSPQSDASEVVEKGSTIELPISEDEYKEAEKAKVLGKSLANKEVIGISSLAALAMFIGRLIKIAHGHAKRLVFGKGDK